MSFRENIPSCWAFVQCFVLHKRIVVCFSDNVFFFSLFDAHNLNGINVPCARYPQKKYKPMNNEQSPKFICILNKYL